jgi:Uncharacterized protein conserved in bacteria (DUF2188)
LIKGLLLFADLVAIAAAAGLLWLALRRTSPHRWARRQALAADGEAFLLGGPEMGEPPIDFAGELERSSAAPEPAEDPEVVPARASERNPRRVVERPRTTVRRGADAGEIVVAHARVEPATGRVNGTGERTPRPTAPTRNVPSAPAAVPRPTSPVPTPEGVPALPVPSAPRPGTSPGPPEREPELEPAAATGRATGTTLSPPISIAERRDRNARQRARRGPVIVRNRGNEWVVEREGAKRVSSIHPSRELAELKAARTARREQVRLEVHAEDGSIVRERDYSLAS